MTSGGFSDNSVHAHTTCMATGCYGMTLHDAGADGWNGWLEIWVDGASLTTASYEENGVNAMDFGVGMTCGGDDPEVGGDITNAGMSGWGDPVDFSPYPSPTTGEIVQCARLRVRQREPRGRSHPRRHRPHHPTRTVLPSSGPQGWIFKVGDWSAGMYTVEGPRETARQRPFRGGFADPLL